MDQLLSPRDRTISAVALVWGIVLWAAAGYVLVHFGGAVAMGGAIAIVLVVALLGFLVHVFVQSALIAHLRGNAIEVSEAQLPDLYGQFVQCCEKLSIGRRPRIFVQNGNGVLNAFATWFLGGRYVVLLSTVVDAMDKNPNGARFYVGHELGHIKRHDNPVISVLRWPALRFPLLGAAFSRARESTCDLHGLACSESRESAARSLLALMAGTRRWQMVSLDGLGAQVLQGRGFWMSFHELIASYPWTAKRVLRVLHERPEIPGRNPFAYLLAALVPYSGRFGSGFGVLIYIYLIGVMAAIAIPAYNDYTIRADLAGAIEASQPARDALARYYTTNKAIPESLAAVDVEPEAGKFTMSLDPKGMILAVESVRGTLLFVPQSEGGRIAWRCGAGGNTKPAHLPIQCRQGVPL